MKKNLLLSIKDKSFNRELILNFLEEKEKKWIICNIDNNNYKCPKYKYYYCSIKWLKEPQEKCIAIEGNDQNNENENLNHDKPLYLDEEKDIILEKKDLYKLKGNQKVISMLKNKSSRKL